MKNLFLFIAMFSILCISCKKDPLDPDPGPEAPEGKNLAEATIDEKGGKLESGDVILTVPAGALDTTLTFALSLDEDAATLSTHQVTGTYQLTGLNAHWSKPLELSIKYDGELDGESYIALGYTYYDPVHEDTILVSELFKAVDSLSYLKCTIFPLENPLGAQKAAFDHPLKFHPIVFHTRLMLRGMSSMGTVRSECAEIKYDRGLSFDQSKVEQLAKYIDEAVTLFHTMDLMHSDYFRGKNKLRVQILEDPSIGATSYHIESDLESAVEALSLPKEYLPAVLLQTYLVKIQGSHFETVEDFYVKTMAVQAVLRFINNSYFGEKKNWLLWAIQYWAMEYFAGSYPGSLETSMYMHPFHGINVLNMEEYLEVFPSLKPDRMDIQHGKGLSPLIKYLVENHNTDLDLLQKLYLEMQNSAHFSQPIDALLPSLSQPEYVWWPGFIKAYLTGQVRYIPGEIFMDEINADDELHFTEESDTVKYYDRQYPDLSARLCKVKLDPKLSESVLDETDKLNFRIGPESLNLDYVKVLVFAYKNGELEFLAEGQEVTLNNLKNRMEQGLNTLMAVVVNSASESPYEEVLGIDLTVRILKKKSWPWKYLSFKAVVTDAIFRSGTDAYTWDLYEFALPDRLMNVSEEGSHFSVSWLDKSTDYKYEGGMDLSMDLETYTITGFHMWSNSENYSDGVVTLSEKKDIISKTGLSIPVVYWGDVFCNHQILKDEVCSAIESFTYEHCLYPGTKDEFKNTLESYDCGDDAELLFFWANRPIGVLSED